MRTTGVFLQLALYGVLCSCSKDAKNIAGPPQTASYSLRIGLAEGVDGVPSSGTYSYNAGASVPYSFSLKAGFRHLFVELDGTAVLVAGSVSMTGDRKLFASAEPVPVVSEESRPVAADVSKLANAGDSTSAIAAYLSHLSALDKLYEAAPAKAPELALSAYLSVLESTPIEKVDSAFAHLSGRVFGPDGEVAYAGSGKSGVAIIFVNGILQSSDAAAVSTKGVRKVVEEAGLSEKAFVYNLYNSTSRHEPDKLMRCRRYAVELESGFLLRSCGGMREDLLEASLQIGEILNDLPSEAVPEVRMLEKVISQERSARPVMLIGHSQGTLLIQQALKNLGGNDACVSAISLGGPLGRSSWQESLPEENLEGFVIAGEKTEDILLALGRNDFPRVATDLSRAADERVRELANPNFSVAYGTVSHLFENLKLHNMVRSYLAGDESRARLRELMSKQFNRLDTLPVCHPAPPVQVYVSSAEVERGGSVSAPSDLWVVSPRADGGDALVGRIVAESGKELVIVDVAESPDGELFGITFHDLYRLNKSTGSAKLVKSSFSSRSLNAMAFDSQGRLYVATINGEVRGFEMQSLDLFWEGDFGSGYRSSGDLAWCPDSRMYASVKDNEDRDFLASVDLSSGRVSKVGSLPIGFANVWGLTCIGNELFGFTAGAGSETGSLISIDKASGVGTFVRKLEFSATGASVRNH